MVKKYEILTKTIRGFMSKDIDRAIKHFNDLAKLLDERNLAQQQLKIAVDYIEKLLEPLKGEPIEGGSYWLGASGLMEGKQALAKIKELEK